MLGLLMAAVGFVGSGMTREAHPALRSAYATCRRLHRRHDPTYYWAARTLPAEIRPATHALYAYVRVADEIVDGPTRALTAGARRAALDAWEAELATGIAGGPAHPVVRALTDAGRRHLLPLHELDSYFRSMRLDCAPVRIGSWEELEDYMDGSAASVGRVMAALLGVSTRHRTDLARLGLALQLTNFIRDVREDRGLDRIYLPGDERADLGVGELDLVAPRASPGLRRLVARQVARARRLFALAEPAVAAAPPPVRRGMRVTAAAYRHVLDRVEAAGFDVLAGDVSLGPRDLPAVVHKAMPR